MLCAKPNPHAVAITAHDRVDEFEGARLIEGQPLDIPTTLELHDDFAFKVSHGDKGEHEGIYTPGAGSPPEIVLLYRTSSNQFFSMALVWASTIWMGTP